MFSGILANEVLIPNVLNNPLAFLFLMNIDFFLPQATQFDRSINVFYLNKNLFEFNKINSPECSFCKCEEETTIHLFHICRKTQALWTQLTSHLNRHLNLPYLTPQSAIFAFLDISNKAYLIVNHLLLLFKYYI